MGAGLVGEPDNPQEHARDLDGVLRGTPLAFDCSYRDAGGTFRRVRVDFTPDSVSGDVTGFAPMAVDP